MRKLLFFVTTVLCLHARSQSFDYTIATDSTAWNELNAQTILNAGNSSWQFSYRIPIGFTFNYLGHNFDSLTIETNGYLVFDSDRYYAFTMFNQFGDRVDASGNHAVLGYELSGTAGSRVLKIQYKNTGIFHTDERYLSWQVWLNENGTLEVHTGPNTYYSYATEVTAIDSVMVIDSISQETTYLVTDSTYLVYSPDTNQYARIGLINQNMDTEVRGLFLSGSPSAPASRPVNDANPDTALLTSVPAPGYRYIFTPSAN